MKKILSLFCALALVVSASATVQLTPAQINQLKKADLTSVQTGRTRADRQISSRAQQMTSVAKPAHAAQEGDLDVFAVDATYFGSSYSQYSGASHEWDLILFGSEENGYLPQIYFDIEGIDSTHLEGTYDILNDGYSFIYFSKTDRQNITSGQITFTWVEGIVEPVYHVNLQFTCEGGESYTVDQDLYVLTSDGIMALMVAEYLTYITGEEWTVDDVLYYAEDLGFNFNIIMEDGSVTPSGLRQELSGVGIYWDMTAEEGTIRLGMQNTEDLYVCMAYVDAEGCVTGTYDLSPYYIGSHYLAAVTGESLSLITYLIDGGIDLTVVGDSTISVTGEFLGEDGTVYYFEDVEFKLYESFPLEPAPTTVDVVANGIEVDLSYLEKYGEIDINFDFGETGFGQLVFIPEDQTITALPTGTFDIAAPTMTSANVFSPSEGYDSQNGPLPSFIAIENGEDEEVSYEVFYLVSGSLTVAEVNGETVISGTATSAKGSTINFNMTTDVKNIVAEKVAAKKSIENGHLIIKSGDLKFNAAGAKLN